MAFDQDLAASVRTALAGVGAIREVKMFGGIGFMLNGNLVVAVSKRGLLVRVGKDHRGNALAQQGCAANGDARANDGGLHLCRSLSSQRSGRAEMASTCCSLRANTATQAGRIEAEAGDRKAEMMMFGLTRRPYEIRGVSVRG